MPDYKKGKIYCLRSHQTDKIYIGSTVEKLSLRKAKHKNKLKDFSNGKYHYVTSFELIKFDDCYIELIENYPCKDKAELERREGQFQRSMDCVNKKIAGRTQKEYTVESSEKLSETRKKYREKNKEQIKLKKGKQYICECGGSWTYGHGKPRHEKTQKHQTYLTGLVK